VDCSTYIENYLTPHVDGQLSAEETVAVEQHLAGCAICRARFAEDRAVKALLRERSQMRRTPVQVRGSILAALDAADQQDLERSRTPRQLTALATIRRPYVWIPTALAAAVMFAFVILHTGATPAHAVPAFDMAIDSYAHFVEHFEPNVPSASYASISDAYMDHKMPGFLWNFQPSGYKLVGGRVDRLPDGSPVTYTFYRGGEHAILCIFAKSHGLEPPPGAVQAMGNHTYYNYKGYSICLSYLRSDFICMLVSGRSMDLFVQDIMASSL
jgi:hypothetical protein